jgi:Zn2+/Cd2+-exporting ATPase
VSTFASPASDGLRRALEADLTGHERTRIGLRLGSAMLACGLLLVAWLQQALSDPGQYALGEVLKSLAAIIVSIPIFIVAVRGLIANDSGTVFEQLVALAVLAALASGEFVTAVLVPLIVDLGHFLEQRSVLGAQAAIAGLRTLHARKATLLTASGEREVEPSALQPGDVIVLRPGDVIPADGVIRQGNSTVDQSSITGESVPDEVEAGSRLFAGSVNLTGLLEVKVTDVGEKTALGRVVDLLKEAEQSRTPAVRLMERYAGYYVPVVLMIAAVVLFLTRDMSRAITVLLVSCPGAFVLAGPAAMIAALATASRLGILIKNSKFLETLADVDTVVLDKTGTVTLGHLEVIAARPIGDIAEDELLRTAAVCARGSRHPASRAVVRAVGKGDVPAPALEEVPGQGVIARLDGRVVMLGKHDWLREQGIPLPENPAHDGPVVWVARDGVALGCILLADLPRPEAIHAVEDLRSLGLERVVLLTGDRREVATKVAQTLGITEVIADVLPEQKLEVVQAERRAGNSVMVVGDGVNDALALASGDVGVAMGAMGSDVALKSADVALMTNDLGRLPLAIRLSRQTRSTINQNICVGAGFSVLMLVLASAGIIAPLAGAVLHNAGEIYILINSARLLGFANLAGQPRATPAAPVLLPCSSQS